MFNGNIFSPSLSIVLIRLLAQNNAWDEIPKWAAAYQVSYQSLPYNVQNQYSAQQYHALIQHHLTNQHTTNSNGG